MTEKLYEKLVKVWRENRTCEALIKIPEDFFTRNSALIKSLQKSGKSVLEADIRATLLLRMLFLLQDTLLLRLAKILEVVKEKKALDPSLLSPEEVTFLTIIKGGELFGENTLEVLAGKSQPLRVKGRKFKLVRMLEDLPAIVGMDLVTYGPFKKEDIVLIPYDNAKILITKELAMEIHSPMDA
jgi:DNA replication initiation complex subunit (GINS family)